MNPTPTPTPTPPVQPAAPLPDPVPPPAAPAPAPAYGMGGFIKQFDWVEVGFMVLGVAALCHIIYYYRKSAKAIRELVVAHKSTDARVMQLEAAGGQQQQQRRA